MSHVLLCQGTALHLPLKDASVHCVVTSPPYYGLRDYGTGAWQGGDAACEHVARTARNDVDEASLARRAAQYSTGTGTGSQVSTIKYAGVCGRCGATRVDQQLGLEESPEAYVAAMVQVFREVWRVLRPEGVLFINMGDSYNSARGGEPGNLPAHTPIYERGEIVYRGAASGLKPKNLLGMPWRLALALQADGWILRSDIIWDKPSCMPESVQDRPTRSHEYVFLFSKQAHYHYDVHAIREPGEYGRSIRGDGLYARARLADPRDDRQTPPTSNGVSDPSAGRNARTVWRIPSEPFSGSHFATFPTALVRRCLLAGAPSQVCAACGAPWKRGVERESAPANVFTHRAAPQDGYVTGDRIQGRLVGKGQKLQNWRDAHPPTTLGFAPTCACSAATQPAMVLDPFCGSGTTLLVARELGHHAIGIDLSYPYLHDIARTRLGLAQLAAWTGDAPAPAPVVTYDDLPLFGGF